MKQDRMWMLVMVVLCVGAFCAVAEEAAKDQEPLKIELPEACYGGTPLEYYSENLEEYDFRERPPFLAPKGTALISQGKPVSSSDKNLDPGKLKMIVDGDKKYPQNSRVELAEGVQWVQIDLLAEHALYAILFWHHHEGKRVYFDTTVQISNDPEFKTGITSLYNNDTDNSSGLGVGKDKEYIESYQGRLIDPKGAKARYVRLYSNGSTSDDKNHYTEVEVFGKPGQ